MPKENYLEKVITADDKEFGALRHAVCGGLGPRAYKLALAGRLLRLGAIRPPVIAHARFDQAAVHAKA